MELLYHENTEFHIKDKITEIRKFILTKELPTCGNTKKPRVLTKEVRKLQKYENMPKSIKTKRIISQLDKIK